MKYYIITIVTLLAYLQVNAQLQISPGTRWNSNNTTYIVLENMGLQYDAATTLLDNYFKFTGNSNSTISGSQLPIFRSIELAKNGAAKLVLQRSFNLTQSFTFNGGLCDLNGFDIFMESSAFLNNESETSRIMGSGGYVRMSASLNAPSSANPGNLGVVISSSQNLGAVIIQRGHQSQTNGNGLGNSILRYYDITPNNNSALNATLRLNYFNAELNGLDENSLVFWKSSNNLNWTNEGFTTRNTTTNYVEKTGIAAFSRWTLSSIGNILPVTGLSLSGKWKNNAAELNWTTLAEYNNHYFNIERKYANENNFVTVGKKNSLHADGNSQSPSYYHSIDPASDNRGAIFYRLRQVDIDGKFSYSNTISIGPDAAKVFIEKIYPTVTVQQSIYVEVGNMNLHQMEISLYDMTGRVLLKKKLKYESQLLQLPTLTAGVYQLRFLSGEWQQQSNFIKQ